MNKKQLREYLKLYFIMGSPNCMKEPTEVLQEAIDGGITIFQFREKGEGALKGEARLHLAKELQHICQKNNIPFMINDDVDLALTLDADGIHIGQDDGSIESIRKSIGDKILGVSVHNEKEAIHALQAGADYFGIGPIFPTRTKLDAEPVQGVSLIAHLREKGISTPLVGIGGIHEDNAHEVIKAGADGVSVISAISQAPSVTDAARNIRHRIQPYLSNI